MQSISAYQGLEEENIPQQNTIGNGSGGTYSAGGKKSKIMCIISSTVEMAWIKDFFYNMCKKWSKKVDIFADNPQVIHKLSTKCG